MTEPDLQLIEKELRIELPLSYRERMLNFPLRACSGNSDTELWDDPAEIVKFNRELRAGAPGGVEPWPVHMFATGHGGDGCPVAIDLRRPEAPVWWVDHCHLTNKGSGQTHATFTSWVDEYLAGLRQDLEGDGIDPDGTPEALHTIRDADVRHSAWALVLVIVIAALLIVGIQIWRTWSK